MTNELIHVCLADDDADDRLFFKEAFELIKIKTTISLVNDGVELMDFLYKNENQLPHIVFLDLNMPRKSGMECLLEIKQEEKFKDIPIAIYSTSAADRDIEDAFIKGANIYIRKPNDFEKLKKILNDVIAINWQYHTNGLNRENFVLSI
jgi:CheY-like chemotaxis protein